MWLWSAGLHLCTIGLSKVYIVILLIIGIQDLFLLITSKMLNIFENWIVSWWNYRHHKDCSLWKTVSTWESMLHCSTWFLFKFYTSMFAWLLKFFPLSNSFWIDILQINGFLEKTMTAIASDNVSSLLFLSGVLIIFEILEYVMCMFNIVFN